MRIRKRRGAITGDWKEQYRRTAPQTDNRNHTAYKAVEPVSAATAGREVWLTMENHIVSHLSTRAQLPAGYAVGLSWEE